MTTMPEINGVCHHGYVRIQFGDCPNYDVWLKDVWLELHGGLGFVSVQGHGKVMTAEEIADARGRKHRRRAYWRGHRK